MFPYEHKFDDLAKQLKARGLTVEVHEVPDYHVVTIRGAGRMATRFVSMRKVRLGYSTAWFQKPGKALYKTLVRALRDWETQ